MSEDFWNDETVNEFVNLRIHDGNPFAETGLLNAVNDIRMRQFKLLKQYSNKDWEIVMFKDLHDSATPFRTVKDRDNSIAESEMLKSSRYEVYSVRRKSDNEVFSVGDGCSGFGYEEISHFTIAGKEMIASFKSGNFCNIDFLRKKEKQKLFTTSEKSEIIDQLNKLKSLIENNGERQ